jgi:hypothetical protein
VQLQSTLPAGSPIFSNPLLFNNIFWDNRAGSRGTNMVTGIGAAGDASPINYWDIGTADASGLLAPTNSIIQIGTGITPSATNIFSDPTVVSTHDISLTFTSWRTNVNFIGAIMVTADLPPTLMGNYHLLNSTSPAFNKAAASKAVPSYQQPPLTLAAPTFDFDNQVRPSFGGYDIGADEIATATTIPMHIGSLTATAVRTSTWQATVTVTVLDGNNAPISGAVVTGTWTNGTGSGSGGTGGTTCTTGATGQCTVTRTGIALTRTSMIFTVSGVTKSSGSPSLIYQYQPGSITTITVTRP